MLTFILFTFNALITVLGIYLFDYQSDAILNQPLIWIVSLIIGSILMVLLLILYIEISYHIVGKTHSMQSMKKHKIANFMIVIPLHLTNTRVTVFGKEHLPKDPGFSIYSNHTSLLDIPLLMGHLNEYPIAFLAKESVRKLPFIGKWIEALGCVLIDRSNDRKGAEAIIKTIKHVKTGSSMVIFPEGTRYQKADDLIEFKAGAFKVAIKSKKPLVPVTILKPNKADRKFFPFPIPVKVIIHKPIPYEEYQTMNTQELSNHVKSIIRRPIDEYVGRQRETI